MRICSIIFFALFAFKTMAGDIDAPTNAIVEKYDAAVVDKISWQWGEILNAMTFKTPPPVGKIVLEFRLFPDGHVSDLKVDSTNAEESLVAPCKKAVLDSVPFPSWTKEMRQVYTNDYRLIHYTFYYRHEGDVPPNTALEPTPTAP